MGCCNGCVGVDGRRGIDGQIGQEDVQSTHLLPEAGSSVVLAVRPTVSTSRSVAAAGTLLGGAFCGTLQVACNLVSRERRDLHSLAHPLRCQTLVKVLVGLAGPYRFTGYLGQDSRISGIVMVPFFPGKEDGHG